MTIKDWGLDRWEDAPFDYCVSGHDISQDDKGVWYCQFCDKDLDDLNEEDELKFS